MLKRADVVLMATITICALAFMFAMYAYDSGGKRGAGVSAIIGGRVSQTVSLNKDGQYNLDLDGAYNIFEVNGGNARMTQADCPDGLCLRQSAISREGETIVCLPHRLVLKVTGGEENPIDALSE